MNSIITYNVYYTMKCQIYFLKNKHGNSTQIYGNSIQTPPLIEKSILIRFRKNIFTFLIIIIR